MDLCTKGGAPLLLLLSLGVVFVQLNRHCVAAVRRNKRTTQLSHRSRLRACAATCPTSPRPAPLQLLPSATAGGGWLGGDDSWGRLPVQLKLRHPSKAHKGMGDIEIEARVGDGAACRVALWCICAPAWSAAGTPAATAAAAALAPGRCRSRSSGSRALTHSCASHTSHIHSHVTHLGQLPSVAPPRAARHDGSRALPPAPQPDGRHADRPLGQCGRDVLLDLQAEPDAHRGGVQGREAALEPRLRQGVRPHRVRLLQAGRLLA